MNEELIRDFALRKDKSKVQEFYNIALNILTSALDELNNKSENGVIKLSEESTRIFPMGDYTNDTFIDQTGELEIVVATNDAQVILNTTNYSNEIKNKKNKKNTEISQRGTIDIIVYKLLEILVSYFSEDTTLFLTNDGIKILCLKEYGFKMLIRFATYSVDDENATLFFWEPVAKVQNPVNLFVYNEQMENKDKETNGNYKRLVRIYKNIRKTILLNKWSMSSDLNKYFVELIIYNIPKQDALNIAKELNQESIIWKDNNYFGFLDQNGNEENPFKNDTKNMTFDDKITNMFGSRLRSGNTYKPAFAFECKLIETDATGSTFSKQHKNWIKEYPICKINI